MNFYIKINIGIPVGRYRREENQVLPPSLITCHAVMLKMFLSGVELKQQQQCQAAITTGQGTVTKVTEELTG